MDQTTPRKVLFLCTGNSVRSIVAEHVLRAKGRGRFEVYSGGSHPAGVVHPLTLRTLRERYGLDASTARSKSWDEFAAQEFDFVITLCDLAKAISPTWPGGPLLAHWGSPDPAGMAGSEARRFQAFVDVASQIARRIDIFCAFPEGKLRDADAVGALGQRFLVEASAALPA